MRVKDLKPGDRVVIRCHQSRVSAIPITVTFDRFHDAASVQEELRKAGTAVLPGAWRDLIASGKQMAAFRMGPTVAVFEIDRDGTLWDDEGREIELLTRADS